MKYDDKYPVMYASKERNFIFNNIIHDSFELLKYNSLQYPDQDRWYYLTNVPRVLKGEGEQIVLLDGDTLIAMIALKFGNEPKLCSVRVDDNYQKQGIFTYLFDKTFDLLKTDKPLVTISESNLDMFDSIIKRYDWKLSNIILPDGSTYAEREYVFNDKVLTLKNN